MTSKGSGIRVVVYDENQKIQPIIRQTMIESIAEFHHLPSCISFIQQNAQDERATVIVTTTIDDQTLQLFESLDPVEAILIISSKEKDLIIDQLPSKVNGIYSQMDNLLRSLIETLDLLELQLDADSLLFHRHRNGHENPDFYFFYLWETYNPNKIISKKILLDQARILFHYDQQVKPFMHDFNLTYKSNEVLQWLEKYHHPFPYHLLVSNALRTHDQQILSLVRFFILDLIKQMKPLPAGASFNQVFFGAKLPIAIVDRLEQQTEHDIIAFQCFLPVTRSRNHAVLTATRPTRRRKIANVLFKIDATHALCVPMGEILLLNMATPFHVTRVSRNAGSGGVQQLITIVNLEVLNKSTKETLVGHFIQKQKKAGKTIDDFIQRTIPLVRPENSYEGQLVNRLNKTDNSIPLYVVSVTKPIRPTLAVCKEEIEADEHIRNGHWALAVDALARVDDPNVRVLNKQGCLLRERLHDLQSALECHQQALAQATDRGRAETLIYLGIAHHDSKEYAEAIKCYSQSLEWFERQPSKDSAMIARCLVGLGNAHWARRELDEALACAERALVLREHAIKPRNDFDIAACLGNMGNILHDQGDYARALSCARRAAEIITKCAPSGDPRICAALNNLGAMYQACGDYVKARDYFQRALKVLPDENHPHRQSTLNNIARLNELENARK